MVEEKTKCLRRGRNNGAWKCTPYQNANVILPHHPPDGNAAQISLRNTLLQPSTFNLPPSTLHPQPTTQNRRGHRAICPELRRYDVLFTSAAPPGDASHWLSQAGWKRKSGFFGRKRLSQLFFLLSAQIGLDQFHVRALEARSPIVGAGVARAQEQRRRPCGKRRLTLCDVLVVGGGPDLSSFGSVAVAVIAPVPSTVPSAVVISSPINPIPRSALAFCSSWPKVVVCCAICWRNSSLSSGLEEWLDVLHAVRAPMVIILETSGL